MRLLIDACVAGSVARALRHAGFEVEWVAEWKRDPGDRFILQHAFETGQILITRDKDFGELIFRDNQPHCGLLRLAGEMTHLEQAKRVLQALEQHKNDLQNGLVVTVDSERMRVSQGTTTH
jgi:predicted nuclease of predicted toxin-antitoxin system